MRWTCGNHSTSVELFDSSMAVDLWCFRVQSGNEFPMLDWIEVMLILDHNKSVFMGGCLQSFQILF